MMVFDTNVLVYAGRDDSEFHVPCRERLAQARTGSSPVFLTWNVCYEFLRVITHPSIYPQPWSLNDGCRFLATLLESPRFGLLRPTERHLMILSQIAAEHPALRGNVVHDMHTAVLMREHGITQICTMDSDFRRFPFIEVIDPRQ
ncbi:MAG: PIN domain-containing protein [Chloroflexota bacterium]|nr:PIN domain-containing protein [Chloroflexota bacterium]MDE2961849.1 PIN domain-containing protein [Chloroflexota bacterium]